MATKEEILDSIGALTVLELKDLLDAFEERFGVTAAAPVAVAAAAPGGGAAAPEVEEKDEFAFDFDLLDDTKLIPEELVPVRTVGKLVLNRNPDNYFAETEQVAFCLSHIIPGIDGPQGSLGPTLAGIATRPMLSNGTVQNTPANLARFVQTPQALNPQSSMPPIGLSDADAEAIAAYLQTLR